MEEIHGCLVPRNPKKPNSPAPIKGLPPTAIHLFGIAGELVARAVKPGAKANNLPHLLTAAAKFAELAVDLHKFDDNSVYANRNWEASRADLDRYQQKEDAEEAMKGFPPGPRSN